MNKKFTTCSILFTVALLCGCNDSSTNGDAVTATAGTAEATNTSNTNARADHLEYLVNKSDLTFYGKLKEMTHQISMEGIPHRFATYDIHQVISGDYSNPTITLKFVGGEFGDGKTLNVSNSPELELYEESILMVQKHEDTGCDLVDCELGRFKVENGQVIAANESAVVINEDNKLVYVSKTGRKDKAHKNLLDNMSVDKFLSHLKGIVANKSPSKGRPPIQVVDLDRYVPFQAPKALTSAGPAPTVDNVKNAASQQQGSAFDQWEMEQLRQNGGNAVLGLSYPGDNQ